MTSPSTDRVRSFADILRILAALPNHTIVWSLAHLAVVVENIVHETITCCINVGDSGCRVELLIVSVKVMIHGVAIEHCDNIFSVANEFDCSDNAALWYSASDRTPHCKLTESLLD